MRLKVKLVPEPGQSDGSGSSQIPRLLAAPAPKPLLQLLKYYGVRFLFFYKLSLNGTVHIF